MLISHQVNFDMYNIAHCKEKELNNNNILTSLNLYTHHPVKKNQQVNTRGQQCQVKLLVEKKSQDFLK